MRWSSILVAAGALAACTPGSSGPLDDEAGAFERRALPDLARAATVIEALHALGDATTGGRSWTMIDRAQHIAWTTHAYLLIRQAAAYT